MNNLIHFPTKTETYTSLEQFIQRDKIKDEPEVNLSVSQKLEQIISNMQQIDYYLKEIEMYRRR